MKTFKLNLRILSRLIFDIVTLDYFKFAKLNNQKIEFNHCIELSQEIKPNLNFNNKIFNLTIASDIINKYVIMPNEIFSFWSQIGNPNSKFKNGRVIKNGLLAEEIGGGICQVSGIIYLISIIGKLKILERHNHSTDIYNEETRFAPLGSDSTVVYGYKDLRVLNSYTFPIKFEIQIVENLILIKLFSKEKIIENKINYDIKQFSNIKIVRVFYENEEDINISNYLF